MNEAQPQPARDLPQSIPPLPGVDQAPHAPSLASARWLVLIAALMWSTGGFFAKADTFAGWSGPALAFWRAAFACVVLFPLVRRVRWSWGLLPMAISFALMNYCYLTAMVAGSAANAIWLQATAPMWVLPVGVFVFGERATWRDALLILFVIAGIGIILGYESQGASFAAVLWGLASGVFYAGVVLSLRQLRAADSFWLASVNHGSAALCLAPFALNGLFGGPAPLPSGVQWVLLACFGIVQMGLPYALFARGLRSIPGHEAAGIGLIEPILVPIWVFLAWGDRPAWWTLVGGGLIFLGLALRYLRWPAWPAPQAGAL